MFDKKVYEKRREILKKRVGGGVILFPGNVESPMNYPANTFHFRQDSTFLYYFGIDRPDFFGMIDIDEGKDYIFGYDFTIDDIIWMGPQPSVKELGLKASVNSTGSTDDLNKKIKDILEKKRKVHFLPPYRGETAIHISHLLGISAHRIKDYCSVDLIKAVAWQRSYKSEEEISEIEKALDISWEIYNTLLKIVNPGKYEFEMVAEIEKIITKNNSNISFPIILSVHGETLHNHFHKNRMDEGNLLIIDSGAESPEYYASDITRTFPVSGKFTPVQKDIYEIVLKANETSIEFTQPGRKYKDIHLLSAQVIASGLKDVGLMKGNTEDAVNEGAHALFFPHGLGHMMGLDVHDMENLGENYIGYNENIKRSSQFGLAYLRLAKELEPGYVFTVEPGVYFIPALIDQWKKKNRHADFINYDLLEKYRGFGGIRIEDDVLVKEKGHRVLGKPIPKSVKEIEEKMS